MAIKSKRKRQSTLLTVYIVLLKSSLQFVKDRVDGCFVFHVDFLVNFFARHKQETDREPT
jgi:hypothetical protein